MSEFTAQIPCANADDEAVQISVTRQKESAALPIQNLAEQHEYMLV